MYVKVQQDQQTVLIKKKQKTKKNLHRKMAQHYLNYIIIVNSDTSVYTQHVMSKLLNIVYY